jgi:Transcriptional Coactivator p15 (PC4)
MLWGMDNSDQTVYAFPKNRNEEVRATLNTFKGQRYAHLRVYVADENDVDHPTRKGIAVKVEHLPKLLAAVDALIEAA